ncbi:hypothetical protein FRACYDRAFT_218940, partial [Fragilariopsis cylindrus CCMP1102]
MPANDKKYHNEDKDNGNEDSSSSSSSPSSSSSSSKSSSTSSPSQESIDEDQSCSSELRKELQKLGLSSSFVVHHKGEGKDDETETEIDMDSLGNGSYIDDLMGQRIEREKIQREETMEIAL